MCRTLANYVLLLQLLLLQRQQEAAAGHEAGADSAAAAAASVAASGAAAARESSEGGLDDDELAELANDPELDAYLQVGLYAAVLLGATVLSGCRVWVYAAGKAHVPWNA
jgi:hypothetical protein